MLAGQQPLDLALTPVPGVDGLWAFGTREVARTPPNCSAAADAVLIDELAGRFDIVLIDSPPVLPVADAMILSRYADAVLLVVAADLPSGPSCGARLRNWRRRARRSWARC